MRKIFDHVRIANLDSTRLLCWIQIAKTSIESDLVKEKVQKIA